MAMSRSMGASSLILCSSIWISPDEISSSPATMRSVVVLPQPEGPTSTTNSRSRISRFTSLTACTSSYFLLRFFSRTRAMSALHAAGHSGDIVLDEERIDDGDRNRADQRAGHERPPEEDVAADQLRDHAHRHQIGRASCRERV